MSENNKTTGWEKVRIISIVIGSVLVPVALVIVGYFVSNALKEKETRVQYVDIATNILKEEPSEANKQLRTWAIDILDKYAPIRFSEEALKELDTRVIITPTRNFIFETTKYNVVSASNKKSKLTFYSPSYSKKWFLDYVSFEKREIRIDEPISLGDNSDIANVEYNDNIFIAHFIFSDRTVNYEIDTENSSIKSGKTLWKCKFKGCFYEDYGINPKNHEGVFPSLTTPFVN